MNTAEPRISGTPSPAEAHDDARVVDEQPEQLRLSVGALPARRAAGPTAPTALPSAVRQPPLRAGERRRRQSGSAFGSRLRTATGRPPSRPTRPRSSGPRCRVRATASRPIDLRHRQRERDTSGRPPERGPARSRSRSRSSGCAATAAGVTASRSPASPTTPTPLARGHRPHAPSTRERVELGRLRLGDLAPHRRRAGAVAAAAAPYACQTARSRSR